MEGVNVGAIMICYIGILILAGAALVALGLLLAGWTRAARIVFASGTCAAFLLWSLADFSFFQRGMGFQIDGLEPLIAMVGAAMLFAGVGQFVGGLRNRRAFAASIAFAIGSVLVLMPPMFGAEVFGGNIAHLNENVLGAISLVGSLLSLACGVFISLPADPDHAGSAGNG